MLRGVPHRRAHARRQPALHAGQAGFDLVVEALVEILEAVVLHIVATIRGEAVHREGVADAVDGRGHQRRRLARELQDGLVGTGHRFVGGFGKVQQHHHRQVAVLDDIAHGDARIGLLAHADRNHGVDGGVDVDLVAVFHVAHALHAFRCQQVDDLLDAVRDRLVFRENILDIVGIANRLAALKNRHPVGPV